MSVATGTLTFYNIPKCHTCKIAIKNTHLSSAVFMVTQKGIASFCNCECFLDFSSKLFNRSELAKKLALEDQLQKLGYSPDDETSYLN